MPMPTFFMIGAAKSGTSALYSYLGQHPEVFLPAAEEPSWFAFADHELAFTAPDEKPPAVNSQAVVIGSEYVALYESARPDQTCGDVSPVYLYWPGTAERVASKVPEARVIAILRHPVDRAYSAFMHARREGREPLDDFRAALTAEKERIAGNCGFIWRYRDLGDYAPQLRRWFEVLPRHQFLLATYDEFAADPVGLCKRIQSFIGVSEDFIPDTGTRHNTSGIPRSPALYDLLNSHGPLARFARGLAPIVGLQRMKGAQARMQTRLLRRVPLDPDIRSELVTQWRPQIESLVGLVDLDIEGWLRPSSLQPS